MKLLFIRASDSVAYQAVITAMDLAREAGVQELAWVPRGIPLEQRGNSR